MPQQITISTIESKQFSEVPRGYNQEEVDTFLDDICDEMERMIGANQKLQQQLREAQVALQRAQQQAPAAVPASASSVSAPSADQETSFREILQMAQKVKEETISEARKKAETILSEAQTQAEEQLGSIAKERDSLSAQVDELKKTVQDYRERFTALIRSQQEAMDKLADL